MQAFLLGFWASLNYLKPTHPSQGQAPSRIPSRTPRGLPTPTPKPSNPLSRGPHHGSCPRIGIWSCRCSHWLTVSTLQTPSHLFLRAALEGAPVTTPALHRTARRREPRSQRVCERMAFTPRSARSHRLPPAPRAPGPHPVPSPCRRWPGSTLLREVSLEYLVCPGLSVRDLGLSGLGELLRGQIVSFPRVSSYPTTRRAAVEQGPVA